MAGVFKIDGIMGWRGHASWNTLYPLPARVLCAVIRLLLHVFPIQGSVFQFPRDKGFSLPRYCESDTRVRVQGIPKHIAKKAKEGE